jgi:site-specific DNA-methyltransferase (adenine-specific)
MFSFVGDTVLDPFGGTGTTALAALQLNRSSITYEVERKYYKMIQARLGRPRLDDDATRLYLERPGEDPESAA